MYNKIYCNVNIRCSVKDNKKHYCYFSSCSCSNVVVSSSSYDNMELQHYDLNTINLEIFYCYFDNRSKNVNANVLATFTQNANAKCTFLLLIFWLFILLPIFELICRLLSKRLNVDTENFTVLCACV